MRVEGAIFGIVGALLAFPRRLAAREVKRRGGVLRRGITRRTAFLVFGRTLLDRLGDAEIEQRFDDALTAGATILSENGFRRGLGLLRRPEGANLSRAAVLEQSRLDPRSFDLLALFDAFEHDAAPFALRDVILARKYAGLLQSGAGWAAIVRSVHRTGAVTSLTAKSLHAGGTDEIYVRDGETLREIDGQAFLPFESDADPDALFDEAEGAEKAGRFGEAAALYGRYLSLDPADSVAAFNRANALKGAGAADEAAHAYAQAIKLDPGFVEAWFNFASLLATLGRTAAAREHFARAIEIDPDYADPVYNLAALEFKAGRLPQARAGWARYLELDPDSVWARRAARGIQYIDLSASLGHTSRRGRSA